MHIAVLDKEKCHPKKCNHECQFYCPPVRSGTKTIEFVDTQDQPIINEPLCIGCGICVRRCPFGAIKIINVPDEMNKDLFHQYGLNKFRLYSVPALQKGKVVAILGKNGLGKTTALNILSGVTIPNFGDYGKKPDQDLVIEKMAGTQMGQYFKDLYNGKKKVALKNQYVDQIPRVTKGTIGEIIVRSDIDGRKDEIISTLEMQPSLNKDISSCSGGELQKLAIAVTLLKNADVMMFDEMSSYLDIGDRLRIARIIQDIAKDKTIMVVEHDLAILDWIADEISPIYGESGAYGVIGIQRSTNKAINSFLSGYLKEENVRISTHTIEFSKRSAKRTHSQETLVTWQDVRKTLGDFTISSDNGDIARGEVVGAMGRNALGKTTFVKMLAGVLEMDQGSISRKLRIAYKPQYISTTFEGTAFEMLSQSLKERMSENFVKGDILAPLDINEIMYSNVQDLSGGEMQRLSIALTLGTDADLYLLDEPSAHLDASFRMATARVIRRVMENTKRSAIVVDHDIYFTDLISDRLMVFQGKPGIEATTFGPTDMRTGMNMFLKGVGITFRRDEKTMRPRINKANSSLDRQQKEIGEYYYSQ
jgi:ATP-binding cassette subfamily E protein 1